MNDDSRISSILQQTRTIAFVGASLKPNRHSYRVMIYMQRQGYRVLPVNPVYAGRDILGETVAASLADIPGSIDMVDIFRRPEVLPETVADILAVASDKKISFVWMQLGLADQALAARVRQAGLDIVMDRCLKIEYGRLMAGA